MDHEKRLKNLEDKLSDFEQKISACESTLSDPTLYQGEDSSPKLISLQDDLHHLQEAKELVEDEALTLMELLTN
jgi:proline dehydrogenase